MFPGKLGLDPQLLQGARAPSDVPGPGPALVPGVLGNLSQLAVETGEKQDRPFGGNPEEAPSLLGTGRTRRAFQ